MRSWARRLVKFGGYVAIGLVVLLAAGLTFTVGWTPVLGAKKRPLTSRHFQPTPERMRRGEYLVHAVTKCMGCHSQYDEKVRPPVLLSREGAGRVLFEEGSIRIVAPNITPDRETGLGRWSDDAIVRAIREGIADDGRALVPVMPYEEFRQMSDEDVASVVVFLRCLPPVRSELPAAKLPFLLVRFMQASPHPVEQPVAAPDLSAPAKRGRYLVEMGGCRGCHTPRNALFQEIPGMELAGGTPVANGDGVASANLTPDASGISYYDETQFVTAIRTGAVGARKLHTAMPWWIYREMTDDDLKAVYAYLRTLKPVHHNVDNTETAAMCKRCGKVHGLGKRN